jgi:hypothetical protein
MLCRYFACPSLSLLRFYLNRNPTAITNQVMMMVFRAVSEERFPCIHKRIG